MKNLEQLTTEELRREVVRLNKEYTAAVTEFERRSMEEFTKKALGKSEVVLTKYYFTYLNYEPPTVTFTSRIKRIEWLDTTFPGWSYRGITGTVVDHNLLTVGYTSETSTPTKTTQQTSLE